jgi:fibronectin-binding autotransporter adhesin
VTIGAGNTLTLGAAANDINLSAATANLTLNCALVLGDANVWNVATGRTLTLGGIVSGTFPVTKEGGGTAVLSGNSTYTGSTTLSENSGTFEIGGSGRLGNGTYSAAIEIGSGSTFRFNSSAAQTLDGDLGGAGAFVKSSTGTLTLAGSNAAFTGPVTISAGTLNLGSTGALGNASAVSIAGGATLSSQTTGIVTAVPVTLGSSGTTSTISFSRNTAAQGSITLNGLISGDGNLTFSTPNVISGGNLQTVFLGSANAWAGSTTISTGNSNNSTLVKALVADSLPPGTVLTLNGGNGAGSGRSVGFDLNSFDQTLAGLANITGLTSRSQRIINSGGDSVTLTIDSSAIHTYSGTISGTGLSVLKTGSGTQTFSGANSYTGDTSVEGGTLTLGSINAANEASTVTIAGSGALLHLAFAGTDAVDKLFIGAAQQAAGTYGHGSTGADNGGQGIGSLDAYFAVGTGTLTVASAPPVDFPSWIAGTFANGSIPVDQRGPDDDADHDGIPNLLEFALAGLDPTVSDAPVGGLTGSTLAFTKRPGTSGLSYAIQESTDLGSLEPWTEVASYDENNATVISHTFTPGTPVRNFLRLQVLAE